MNVALADSQQGLLFAAARQWTFCSSWCSMLYDMVKRARHYP